MYTRPAHPSDLSQTSTFSASAFWSDPLFSYTHAHKAQYPAGFRAWFLRKAKQSLCSADMVFHVAVMEEGDEGFEAGDGEMEKVVGYAIWKRYGESEEAKKWKRRRSWMMYIESTFLALTERYSTFTRGDPCLDYDRVSTYISKSATAFKDLPEMIRLVAFAVDPAFQHHGIGSKLIEWGLEQAGKEDCPVGLTSSQGAKGFYEKKGFRRWCSIDVEGVVEVPVLVWELESVVNS